MHHKMIHEKTNSNDINFKFLIAIKKKKTLRGVESNYYETRTDLAEMWDLFLGITLNQRIKAISVENVL